MILEIKDVVTFTNGVIHSVRKQKFAKTNISYPLVHTYVWVLSVMVNSCVKRHFMS